MEDSTPIRRYTRSSFAGNPAASALGFGVLFALWGAALGLWASQYFPVFGYPFSAIARPFSPVLMATIPMHLFTFAGAGFVFGGVVGVANRRGPGLPTWFVMLLPVALAVGLWFLKRQAVISALLAS